MVIMAIHLHLHLPFISNHSVLKLALLFYMQMNTHCSLHMGVTSRFALWILLFNPDLSSFGKGMGDLCNFITNAAIFRA